MRNVERPLNPRSGQTFAWLIVVDAVFAWHHYAHCHNELVSGNNLGGYDAKKMVKTNKKEADSQS